MVRELLLLRIFLLAEFNFSLGNLALARALGDFDYKKSQTLSPESQIITSNPEITEHKITGEDEFLVIACDGTLISGFQEHLRQLCTM